jgi:hypothetical protein
MKKLHLISFAGWEERFFLGASRACDKMKFDTATIFYSQKYSKETEDNRVKLIDKLNARNIKYYLKEVDFSSQSSCWKSIKSYFDMQKIGKNVIVDITTMPREIIWYIFLLLRQNKANVEYIYHKPERYGDWLTEDTDMPRFPLKLSGLSDISKKTFLIIVTGYDYARAEQICNYFEPDKVCFAIQSGQQFNNTSLNSKAHESLIEEVGALTIDIDCYGDDCGEKQLSKIIEEYISTHNLILASLGPKQSAVALFRLAMKHPEIALCYAPSKKINMQYSLGCGDGYRGPVIP